MRHRLALLLAIFCFGGAIASQGVSAAMAAGPHAALVDIDGIIQPGTARFLARAIDKAAEDRARLLIVTLDTPGGLFESTRDMVESILSSSIPVVVYVAPSGAQAGSAGTFITAAAHVAAMAPVTNIGAATPVAAGRDFPYTLESKALQDAVAFMRDIAKARGRNAEALEETVLMSDKAYSATEALDNNIIDLIAKDMVDLLTQLDGRTVQLDEGSIVLRTVDLEVRRIQRTPLERFLGYIGNPNVAFILLSVGTFLVFFEAFMYAGLLVPGITGGILLALAFVGMGQLPVNWAGFALIAAAMVLFVVEIAVIPGITVFGVLGVIFLAVGGLLLFGDFALPGFEHQPIETPSFRVNPWVVGAIAASTFAFFIFLVRDMVAARRSGGAGSTAVASPVGQLGTAMTALNPGGTIRVGQRAVDRRVRFGGGDRRGRRGDGGGGRRSHPEGIQGARDRRPQR